MAGYKETFAGNVDHAYGRGVTDLTSRLQSGVSGLAGAGKGLAAFSAQATSAKRGIKDLGSTMKQLRDDISNATDPKEIKRLTREFEHARKGAEKFRKELVKMPFHALEGGFASVTKGLLKFNTGILTIGFDFLISSIKRVYDLQEKWTAAIGGFNMKIGGMTKGLAGAQQAATQWSSTVRGLTNGDINEGIQMFGEFTMAIGRTVKAGDGFSKLGVQLARGFGIGGAGSGQMLKVFENIGLSSNDAADAMKTSIVAANEAGIPVNMLAEDLSKSTTYMARFGKEGQKTLIQGAAWARKYDIALDQLKNSVEGFDMFDDAAKSASKLNTTFGTMINSMDLMMEDDPAARLEMIRQQMLNQGMTYDKLTPKERRYFSETMKLSEDQTAALLDARNANESYTDFAAKAAAKEKQEINAKAMMQKMLQKTAQTMYAFGMAFDRVTVAIAKAIRPLLEVLGLAKKGGKDFASFGSVMESITKTVIEFFESLAGNDKWNSFMRELANDLKRAGSALKDFVMDGRAADLVGDIAKGMKGFYVTVRDLLIKAVPAFRPVLDMILMLSKHIKELAVAWAGLKIFNMVGGPEKMLKAFDGFADTLKGGGGSRVKSARGMINSGGGGLGSRLGSSAMGAGIGGQLGGTGGAIGGALGGLMGPLGAALGAVIGGSIQHLVDYFTKDDEMEDSVNRLKEAQAKAARAAERNSIATDKASLSLKMMDLTRKRGDSAILELQKGKQLFEIQDKNALIDRVKQLQGFGTQTGLTAQALEHLTTDGVLSKEMLEALRTTGQEYNERLHGLSAQTQEFIDLQKEKMGFEADDIKLALMKNKQAAVDLELRDLKREGDKAHGSLKGMNDKEGIAKIFEIREKIRLAELKKNDIGIGIEKQQAKTLDKQFDLQMKQYEMDMLSRDSNFMQYEKDARQLGAKGSIDDIAKAYLSVNPEAAKSIGKFMDEQGGAGTGKRIIGLATGGVVMRPTQAIIGEAGPEAVIPLNKTNLAAATGGAMGGETVVSTIADVHLDGQKVGRAIVRTAIQRRN